MLQSLKVARTINIDKERMILILKVSGDCILYLLGWKDVRKELAKIQTIEEK